MTQINLMKFSAIWNKLQIETKPNLTRPEKEFCKSFIDAIKSEASK